MKFENELHTNGERVIAKMCKLLLGFETENQHVKDCMIWATSFGYNIQIDAWERIWVNEIKFTEL